jgi:hypothetical protein
MTLTGYLGHSVSLRGLSGSWLHLLLGVLLWVGLALDLLPFVLVLIFLFVFFLLVAFNYLGLVVLLIFFAFFKGS